jgi:hypothetical protein
VLAAWADKDSATAPRASREGKNFMARAPVENA